MFPSRTSPPRVLDRAAFTLFLIAFWLSAPDTLAQVTGRVSVDSSGVEGNNVSVFPSLSADGRFIAFQSHASNLVPGDTNGKVDVFVHDRRDGTTERVSVDSLGNEGNGDCMYTGISADGRLVVFESLSTNLVAGDSIYEDIFVHDRLTGATTQVSVSSAGDPANWYCYRPIISADGRFVSFASHATNLVPGDTNGKMDVFVRDLVSGLTTRVSLDSSGNQGDHPSYASALSGDGRFVAFSSLAGNLVPDDTNGWDDIFVHDRATGSTTRVSLSSAGVETNYWSLQVAISADGRLVAFQSGASNLVPGDTNGEEDIFVHDRQTAQTWRVSVASDGTPGDDESRYPRVDAAGQRVVFYSESTNLVPGDKNAVADTFVHELATGRTTRVSVDSYGTEGDGRVLRGAPSGDGRCIAFSSMATNLVTGDANGAFDVFVQGPELVLEATPETVHIGDPLELCTWTGASKALALLYTTAVGGKPFVFQIASGRFDASGHWTLNYTVPRDGSLLGLDVTLQAFGIGAVHGRVSASGPEVLEIR